MVPIFRGKANPPPLKGQVSLNDPVSFKRYLLAFRPDTDIDIIVRRHEETISDPLRKYYFAVPMKLLAKKTGHSKDDCHQAMKEKFASYYDEKAGFKLFSAFFQTNLK